MIYFNLCNFYMWPFLLNFIVKSLRQCSFSGYSHSFLWICKKSPLFYDRKYSRSKIGTVSVHYMSSSYFFTTKSTFDMTQLR